MEPNAQLITLMIKLRIDYFFLHIAKIIILDIYLLRNLEGNHRLINFNTMQQKQNFINIHGSEGNNEFSSRLSVSPEYSY